MSSSCKHAFSPLEQTSLKAKLKWFSYGYQVLNNKAFNLLF